MRLACNETCASRNHSPGFWCLTILALCFSLAAVSESRAQAEELAPVLMDGRQLFTVRGISAFPADERAARIRAALIRIANDPDTPLDALTVNHLDDRSDFMLSGERLFTVLDSDAAREGVAHSTLADIYLDRIQEAITRYREDRAPVVLIKRAALALGWTTLLAFLLWSSFRASRWLEDKFQHRLENTLAELETKSQRLFHAGRTWQILSGLIRASRLVLALILVYVWASSVFSLFPWTRPLAGSLLSWVLGPLQVIWQAVHQAIPDLIFLTVLFLVFRYLLKLTRSFFTGIAHGTLTIRDFDPDWAMPTYKIVRLALIAFGIVVAYPYIPGSNSLAFKGVSVFLGVMFSIGSSSFIANVLAGLSMIYRGAFKQGDRVQIDGVEGVVHDIKLQITRIVTAKNESVIFPNSNIMNTHVVNYSRLAREAGVVLHTTVGIGYDTPWRQVEAMLLEAVARVPELKDDPRPFVRQTKLDDFAVEYEVNAYCTDAPRMPKIRADLHANIQDVFNEYEVQIMSPIYMNDAEPPKIVPREKWHQPPARALEEQAQ